MAGEVLNPGVGLNKKPEPLKFKALLKPRAQEAFCRDCKQKPQILIYLKPDLKA